MFLFDLLFFVEIIFLILLLVVVVELVFLFLLFSWKKVNFDYSKKLTKQGDRYHPARKNDKLPHKKIAKISSIYLCFLIFPLYHPPYTIISIIFSPK